MDIFELIEQLEDIAREIEADGLGNNAEISCVVAQQPSYPLEGGLRGVVFDREAKKLVIVSGEATKYSSSDYWDEV